MTRPLAITGLGVVCAAGLGSAALADLLGSGRSALARRSRVPTTLIDPGWTGSVPDRMDIAFTEQSGDEVQRFFVDWAITAGREALAQARVLERFAATRVALVIGSNLEDVPRSLWQLTEEVALALAITGPRLVVSMACASALAATSVARMLLEQGDADAVLVGGSDVLSVRVAASFRGLGLLAEQPCSPFSSQIGTALGEGAGLLVLEASEPSEPVIAWLLGEGASADAFHETSPEPRGRGTEYALTAALRQAELTPSDIDLIMTHGTGTEANDLAEARALRRVFQGEFERIGVGAGKSLVGHAQGAAGAIELIAALLGTREGMAPKLANFVPPARAEAPPRLLIDDVVRRVDVRRFVIEGAGFGGAHAAIIVGQPLGQPPAVSHVRRPATLCSWATLVADDTGRVDVDGRRAVRGVDLRACDPSTRMLTAVVDAALRRAGVPRAPRREVGLFVAQRGSSAAALARLRGEIERWGTVGASPSAFVDSLAIMPAGACARMLELWGPLQLICGDAVSGLVALISAVETFVRDASLHHVVAAAVSERISDGANQSGANQSGANQAGPNDDGPNDDGPNESGATPDGAGAIVVGEGGPWTVLSWAITGPDGNALGLASSRAELGTLERVVRMATRDELGRALTLPDARGHLAIVADGLGANAAVILSSVRSSGT